MKKYLLLSAAAFLATSFARAGYVYDAQPFTFSTGTPTDFSPLAGNLLSGVPGEKIQNSAEGSEGTTRDIAALTDGAVPNSKPAAYSVQNGSVLQWTFPDGYQSVSEIRAYALFDWAGHNDISFSTVEVLDGFGEWRQIPDLAFCYSGSATYNTVGEDVVSTKYRRVFVTADGGAPLAENARGLRITFGPANSFSSFAEIEAAGSTTWIARGDALVSGPVAYTPGNDSCAYAFSAPGCILQPQIPMEVSRTVAGGAPENLGIVLPATSLAVPYADGADVIYTCKPYVGTTAPSPVLDAISSVAVVANDTAAATLSYSMLWTGAPAEQCSLWVAYGTDPLALSSTNFIASGIANGDTGDFYLPGLEAGTAYTVQLIAQNSVGLFGVSDPAAYTTVDLPGSAWIQNGGGNWDTATYWDTGVWPNGVGHIADFTRHPISSMDITVRTPVTLGTLLLGSHYATGGYSRFKRSGDGALAFDKDGAPAVIRDANGGPITYSDQLYVPISFGGELQVSVARSATLEFNYGLAGGLLRLTADNLGTLQFQTNATLSAGLDIQSGCAYANYDKAGATDFFGADAAVRMGSASARQAPRLDFRDVTGGHTQSIGSLVLAGPAENIVAVNGSSAKPAEIDVASFQRGADAALTFEMRDISRAGASEKLVLPASTPTDADGMLPPWATIGTYQQYTSRFADLASDGTVVPHPETTSFAADTPSQVVKPNHNTRLASDATARGARIDSNQRFYLDGHTLTLDDNGSAGLLLGYNSYLDGLAYAGGDLDWNGGNLYVSVSSTPTRRTDYIQTSTLLDALDAETTGILSKTGYGRLAIEQDVLPKYVKYRILNGVLETKSTLDTVFDRDAYAISGAGVFEFGGARAVSFLGEDLAFPAVGFNHGVSATVGQGQTLRVRDALQVNNASTLTFTDGARFVNGTVPVYVGENSNDNTLTASGRDPVTGAPTTLDLNGRSLVSSYSSAGYSANRNSIRLSDGAIATNVYILAIGESQGGRDDNALALESGAQVFARYARFGCMCCGAVATVTGEGTLLDLGGGGLEVGESGGGVGPCNNRLLVSDGAVVRNVGGVAISKSSNGNTTNNFIVVSSGARILSSGEVDVCSPNTANGWISNTWCSVEGDGSLWDLGGGKLIVGYALQGYVRNCDVTVRDGGAMRNVGDIEVGRGHARSSLDNTLLVTKNGRLSSSGTVSIGVSSANQAADLYGNRAVVSDGGLWDLNGGALKIGNRANYTTWTRDNWLVLDPGGVVTNAGAATLGYTWNASRVVVTTNELDEVVTTDMNARDNGILLRGGAYYGTTLLVCRGNALRATIQDANFGAAVFSGKAEFQPETTLSVSASRDAPDGRYLVLQADGFTNFENLVLESTDPSRVSIRVDGSAVYAIVHKPATLILLL